MYLYELTDQEKLSGILVAIDQLKLDLEQGKITSNWPVQKLLNYFKTFGVTLSVNDIDNMLMKKPLKDVVVGRSGDEIQFKGIDQPQTPAETPPPEQSQEVVAKMAQKAMPK